MSTGRKKQRWSRQVTETSDALSLAEGVFTRRSPLSIARSLKRSADRSKRRKSDPYRSAMSMLTFYINRAGRNMPATRRRTLEAAKGELRRLYGRERPAQRTTRQGATRAAQRKRRRARRALKVRN
ncbi:MAG: DUF3175 domain-containing protein [Lysobacterales bacterium]|nr:MAG: DUF3175 domain-containing protein [Xanthomonadales bacterium]